MINIKEESDGSLTIDWDKNDPLEKQLNHWTEEDFIRAIREELKKDELQ
jgi:hypothetical protein